MQPSEEAHEPLELDDSEIVKAPRAVVSVPRFLLPIALERLESVEALNRSARLTGYGGDPQVTRHLSRRGFHDLTDGRRPRHARQPVRSVRPQIWIRRDAKAWGMKPIVQARALGAVATTASVATPRLSSRSALTASWLI